jgi:hypothetical protein
MAPKKPADDKNRTMTQKQESLPQDAIPDALAEALRDYEALHLPDLTMGRERVSINLRRIEFVQDNSKNHPKMADGLPTLGRIALSSGSSDSLEVEYVNNLDLLLLDPLFFNEFNLPPNIAQTMEASHVLRRDSGVVGARMQWAHQADGSRSVTPGEPPVCASANGLTPWNRYIGQEIQDYRYSVPAGSLPMTHRIGYVFSEEYGGFVESPYPCLTCPFGEWVNEQESKDGKRKKPMCSPTSEFLVYSLDKAEVFRLKGTNATMQAALMGASPNRFGSRFDGAGMPGLLWHFSLIAMYHEETNVTLDLRTYRQRYQAGQIINPAEWRMLYRNRPYGMPTSEHPDFPVYPVRMTSVQSVKNTVGNMPFISQFTVMDGQATDIPVFDINAKAGAGQPQFSVQAIEQRVVTMEELTAFLQLRAEYLQSGMRETLMGMGSQAQDVAPMLGVQRQPMSLPQPVANMGSTSIISGVVSPVTAQPSVEPPPDIEEAINDPFA